MTAVADRSGLLAPGWTDGCDRSSDPFPWLRSRQLFSAEGARRLAETFPDDGFRIAGGGQPGHRFRYRTLISQGDVRSDGLPAVWADAARELASPAYRRLLGELAGRDSDGLSVDAALCAYEPGCWLRPHTDREVRTVTQVVYLSRDWDEAWGGCLRLLRSEDIDDVAAEVAPAFNTSVLFARSDRSWHAVAPLAEGVARSRRSLLLQLTR